MRLPLEEGKERLPHDGGIGVVQTLEQYLASHSLVAFGAQQTVDEQHLAESGSRLSQGQGGMESEDAVVPGEHRMDGMTHLMRDGGDVARLALVVEQDPGRQIRDRPTSKTRRRACPSAPRYRHGRRQRHHASAWPSWDRTRRRPPTPYPQPGRRHSASPQNPPQARRDHSAAGDPGPSSLALRRKNR